MTEPCEITKLNILNPYWEEVKNYIYDDAVPWEWLIFVHKYSWTISDPESLLFVASYCNGKVLDPLAGTGYWAYLLDQMRIDAIASDIAPENNTWHPEKHERFFPIESVDAETVVKQFPDRTLILSWIPFGYPGSEIIRCYEGDRIIWMGETSGGCCADDGTFEELETNWEIVAEHTPVQWYGIHDFIVVYDRKKK